MRELARASLSAADHAFSHRTLSPAHAPRVAWQLRQPSALWLDGLHRLRSRHLADVRYVTHPRTRYQLHPSPLDPCSDASGVPRLRAPRCDACAWRLSHTRPSCRVASCASCGRSWQAGHGNHMVTTIARSVAVHAPPRSRTRTHPASPRAPHAPTNDALAQLHVRALCLPAHRDAHPCDPMASASHTRVAARRMLSAVLSPSRGSSYALCRALCSLPTRGSARVCRPTGAAACSQARRVPALPVYEWRARAAHCSARAIRGNGRAHCRLCSSC
jgi:hypothetical protein